MNSREILMIAIVLLAASCSSSPTKEKRDYVEYINPMIGASTSTDDGKSYHGLGKTFPGSATPFGLVQLSPDTKTGGDNGPGYSAHHKTIEGFSFVHMSGIGWFGDFGNFLVTPTVGAFHPNVGLEDAPDGGYRSRYSHDNEVASAGYYSVVMEDYGVLVELSSMPRSGIIRMTYPKSDSSRVQIDLARRIGGWSSQQQITILNDSTITGWMHCPKEAGGWGKGDGGVSYKLYFYCQIDKPLTDSYIFEAKIPEGRLTDVDSLETPSYQRLICEGAALKEREARGRHLLFVSDFATKASEQVTLKCGISYVSIDGAKANLESDINHWDFDRVVADNKALWRKALEDFSIEGGSEDEKSIFYTALYHTMIDPRAVSDVTGEYIAADGTISRADGFTYRTIFSGWDVFRSQFPLQTIINPRMVNDEINSLISIAQSSGRGYLPRWEIMNSYSGCMLGNPAVSVIIDAYKKGIRGWDIDKGYEYCINSVEKFTNQPLGYTPRSISKTLEYAYSDWCMAEFARALDRRDDAAKYQERSGHYRNIWSDEVGWFNAKDESGEWCHWYGITDDRGYSMESNPLQQGWFVPHDLYGLIDLMGEDKFATDLEEFFDKAPDNFLWNDYYNHPNEPVHHVPLLFAYAGKPYLTQKWSRRICQAAYRNDIQGLCGNEDVGQMSAWYILASMGIHPVCPGDNIYILTSPIFDRVEISLDREYYSGDKFTVIAHNNSKENIYIKEVRLNGEPLDRTWITHQEIVSGATLEFFMSSEPNLELGESNLPPQSL